MKLSRRLIVVSAVFVFAVAITLFVNMGYAGTLACKAGIASAASCGKYGDGFCNKRCGENKRNCPQDCSGVPLRK
ncbi:MAG: hypothetical protein OEM82_02710 [Acidobacteriota bacterium]|nr:hypothetical protein [Acidobacteriota bacterium]MDH3529294.1 hypothetical protein [Acidobacteriota bacterium]